MAGVPLADSLDGIHNTTPVAWFKLLSGGAEFTIDMIIDQPSLIINDCIVSVSASQIMRLVKDEAKEMTWSKFIENVKWMGYQQSSYSFWNRMSGDLYKPIYLIMQLPHTVTEV